MRHMGVSIAISVHGQMPEKNCGNMQIYGKIRINELMISVSGKFMDYRGMWINIMGMLMINDQ